MRNAFADELTKLACDNPQIVLLSGDIGNRLFDKYKASHPSRFYNCGVAEANMASLAAGLAMGGFRPITYTITPFNTTRCLEQIRVDICYHNLPVIIVGTGAGLSYATLGCTHHSCEDISFLRSIPNMTVLCPGDAMELRSLLRLALTHSGPIYLRIGKTGEPLIHAKPPLLQMGKGYITRKGENICLLSTGNMLPTAMAVGERLNCQVVSFHTVKPLDKNLLQSLTNQFPLICTLEEHSLIGGLGSAIAEWWVDHNITVSRLLRFGSPDLFPSDIGSQTYTRTLFGLTEESLIENIRRHSCRDEPTFSHR